MVDVSEHTLLGDVGASRPPANSGIVVAQGFMG